MQVHWREKINKITEPKVQNVPIGNLGSHQKGMLRLGAYIS